MIPLVSPNRLKARPACRGAVSYRKEIPMISLNIRNWKKSYQDDAIASRVRGLSFADVGGLWGLVNEKVSVALKAGASSASMIDVAPEGHNLWNDLRKRCAEIGIEGVKEFVGNIDDPTLKDRTGTFDFVHCAGVIYHVPSPNATLERLRDLTNRYLLLGSMTVPSVIDGGRTGKIMLHSGQSIFIPSIDRETKGILAEHFAKLEISPHNITEGMDDPWRSGRNINYAPWWWCWPASTLEGMIRVAGFKVVEVRETWMHRAHYFLCEKTAE
jgi:hypothetical protein